MKKLLLGLATILTLAGTAKGTVLTQYDFTGNSLSSSANVTGAQNSGISKVGLANSSATGNQFVFNTTDVGGALNTANNYIKFTIKAQNNYKVDLTTLTFALQSANNGNKANFAVYASYNGGTLTSIGTYASVPTSSTSQTITLASPFKSLKANDSIEFRIYAHDSKKDGYIDNIVLNGDVVPVPEPINVALCVFGLAFVGVGAGRKFLKKKV